MQASSRPYLIRALYQWMLDNDLTPQILFLTQHPDIALPDHLHQEKQLVLNISPTACRGLDLGNQGLSFSARFSGIATDIYVPTEAILAIFAQENGEGMVFGQEPNLAEVEEVTSSSPAKPQLATRHNKASSQPSKPATNHLTVIK